MVVDANGDAGAAAADEAANGEADAPPNENPPPELELDADEPAAAAPPKLNPPDAAAEDAPNDGALPAVPKPNDDDAAELAAAPPKLKAPAAPAFGAAGSSAGPFPAALSRSSWRAFCAASYPALALARNAELKPPALGAAAGLASSFLASSFFSDVVIAGGAKLNPPTAGLAAPNAGAGAAGAGVGAGAAPKLKPPGAAAGAATAPKLGAGAVGAVNASPVAGRSFFTVLVIRGCEIFDSTARTTALSSAGSVSVGATSARPVASKDLGFKPAGLGTTAGESNAPLDANLLMGENAASDAGGGECESTIGCFAVGVEGFGAFLARFSFVSPARILPRTSSSLAVCESIISRRRRSSRIASSRSAGVTASAGRPPLPLDSGRGTAAAASDLAAVDADFSVPLAEPRMPPKPAPRLTRPLDADTEP